MLLNYSMQNEKRCENGVEVIGSSNATKHFRKQLLKATTDASSLNSEAN